jgi:hypothetical protein
MHPAARKIGNSRGATGVTGRATRVRSLGLLLRR